MGEERSAMPADFLADRRVEGERLRRTLLGMSFQLAAIVGFALVILLPLASAARTRRAHADAAGVRLREARAVTVGLKTREKWANRFQSQRAAVEEARSSRRLWLALVAGMANHLPPDTWLTGAACAQDKQGIKAELSGACWSIDRLPMLTAAWAEDENARTASLKSIRNVTIDDAPAVRFELGIRYGPEPAAAAEKAP